VEAYARRASARGTPEWAARCFQKGEQENRVSPYPGDEAAKVIHRLPSLRFLPRRTEQVETARATSFPFSVVTSHSTSPTERPGGRTFALANSFSSKTGRR